MKRFVPSRSAVAGLILSTIAMFNFSDSFAQTTWYLDSDNDGFGDASNTTVAMSKPAGYARNDLDCDDALANGIKWDVVDSRGFSAGQIEYTSLKIDPSGVPYIAYRDLSNSNKVTVMKLNSGTWTTVGTAGFSAGNAINVSLAIDPTGIPYVAYSDGAASNKITVKYYDGTNWITVGTSGFSAGQALYVSMTIDAGGTLYVAYRDAANSNLATVKMYDGTNWVTVGSVGFTAGTADYISLTTDGTIPYIAYRDGANGNMATVMKFDGVNWVTVGSAGFSAGQVTYLSLAINSVGTPYVAYRDAFNANKATVMMFDGSNWATVGAAGFSTGAVTYLSLAMDADDTPYLGFSTSTKGTVMKFDGSNWIALGSSGASPANANWTSLAVSNVTGLPYLAFSDAGNSNAATVTMMTPDSLLPTVTITSDAVANTICNGTTVVFTATPVNGGSSPTYQWKKNGVDVGTNSDTYTDGGLANNDTITVQIVNNDPCFSVTPVKSNPIKMTVKPVPVINAVSDITKCNGTTTGTISFSSSLVGTTYAWTNTTTSIGLAASGTGTISSFTAVNATNSPVVATVTVTPTTAGCPGTPEDFTITVNPTPTVDVVPNQIVCNSDMTSAINFSGFVNSASYSWTNNTTSIGLAASGTGNISAFTATNTTTAPVTATLRITPSANGCTGSFKNFTIKVNPTPTVNAVADIVKCSGGATGNISFSGSVSGTTYAWVNNNTSIGLAASGSGNISSFSATNATNAPISATINVTPTANTCVGASDNFTITVNPIPTVDPVTDQAVCNGDLTNTISFTGFVNNTTYSWTNNRPTIGLATSGTGDIAAFTAVTSTTSPYTATVTVTPSANGCTGSPDVFTITVKPTPTVNAVADIVKCNGATTGNINFTGAVSGTTYAWTNTETSIGLAASGTGNIASFIATNIGNAPQTATITVTPTASSCTGSSDVFTLTVNPTPTVNAVPDQSICNGDMTTAVNFGGSVSGTVYNWTNNKTSIGLAASGTGDIVAFTTANNTTIPVTATIRVTPQANNCTGAFNEFAVVVKPTPTINTISNQTKCNGAMTSAITFSGSVAGTTYNWTNNNTAIGLAASGSGDITSFTATNTTNAPISATITVTPTADGCTGMAKTFTITVNPTPDVDAIADQVLCHNATTTAVVFSSSVSGTTYTWTNNNTAINLAASGSGNIGAFTAKNTTTMPITGTITVTPRANSCNGTPATFDIIVNPIPTVNVVSNQVVCNGSNTNMVSFSGAVTGTTYAWTNNTSSVGLAASGSGDIAPFAAVNNGTAPVTATITVTPTANSCVGAVRTFTIKVNPTSTVNTVSDIVRCHGTSTGSISFGSPVTGTTYAWTNDNVSIGLAANGTGNISSFTATNNTNSPVTATITVTPTANSCAGTPGSFTITVNPIPTVNTIADQTVCNGTNVTPVNFSSAVSGTTYAWTNNNTSIGLPGSGSGNISAFPAVNNSLSPVTATITVTPTANGCTGPNEVFTIRVNPTPTLNPLTSLTKCNNTATGNIVFSGGVSGTTYTWTNNTPSIGLAASGTGNISSFLALNSGNAPVTATITVTPSANGCAGPSGNLNITVNPTPTVNTIADQTVCNGAATSLVSLSGTVAGTTYNWTNNRTSIGLATSGTGDIPSFAAVNNSTTPLIATITVTPSANSCTGPAEAFTITINPTPTVASISNQIRCNGAATNAVSFSGGVTGTSFTWTNSNTAIGLAASGTGNINSFTATNTGVNPITSTIVVTPSANGCSGSTQSFTITVNPTPTVAASGDQTLCNGATTSPVNFSGGVSGTSFTWANNTSSIGLTTSGTGNISAFTANNNTTAPVTATITVTPRANNCSGIPDVFTITVNPTPNVATTPNQTKCNGIATDAVNFTGGVLGTSFAWTNNKTTIGLAASGTGDIGSFTAVNTADTAITATITVTPSANGCTGTSRFFTIKVNPTPIMTSLPDIVKCNGVPTSIAFGSSVSGTSYTWTNTDTSIGLSANGVKNISFKTKNTTTVPIVATIVVTPKASACEGPTEDFTITVNPTPTIDTTWNQVVCNNFKTDSIWFRGPVNGTTFAWTNNRPTVGLVAAGSGDIVPFTALNPGIAPITAVIKVTPSANGCIGIDSIIRITVNPTPVVNPISDKVYCNKDLVDTIRIRSQVSGSTFTWLNDNTSLGIAGSGSADIPAFVATNTGLEPASGTIIVTPTASGCVGPNDTFNVKVNPTPMLSSLTTLATLCGGNRIEYTPTSQTTGTAFRWNRAAVNGILPAYNKDSGVISEVLRNNTKDKIEVTYVYTLTANGCSNDQEVKLFVEPRPTDLAHIVTRTLTEVCRNTFFQNFSADTSVPPGMRFAWSGVNAIIHATGKDKKNCLVSFFEPGEAKVFLYGSVEGFACESIDSVVVNVKESTSQNPRVIYHNQRFICMDNSLETYQWGYDEAGSLDSVLILKEIDQDYYEPNADFNNKYYFVITTKNGCAQKSYYNAPTALKEHKPLEGTTVKVYPNPATDIVTIEIANKQLTKVTVGIMDLSGRLLRQEQMTNGQTIVNISNLPAGVYTVVCHSNGTRIAVTKFVKN